MLVKDDFLPEGSPDSDAPNYASANPGEVLVSALDIAMIVHELRNPLMAMIGYGRLLGQDATPEERLDLGRRFDQTGAHMLMLVNDLLEMARTGERQVQLNLVPVNVLRLMMDSLEVVEAEAKAKGVTLQMDLEYGFPLEFMGDPHRLRQILINLLSNATKFTDRGTVMLRARVDLTAPCLSFSVEDQGVGMTEDEVRRLFHPFRQILQADRKQSGTGLGLVISRNLAIAMGGRLCAYSTPGQGSSFVFSLPFCHRMTEAQGQNPADVSSQISAQDSRARTLGRPEADVSPQTILVVDDHEMLRDLIGALLQNSGHTVDLAASGAEALERVAAKSYDLVLLDRRMPGIDGFETARRMRDLFPASTGPILVGLSGVVSHEDKALARECGMDALFSKAASPLDLIDTITRLVAASRGQRG